MNLASNKKWQVESDLLNPDGTVCATKESIQKFFEFAAKELGIEFIKVPKGPILLGDTFEIGRAPSFNTARWYIQPYDAYMSQTHIPRKAWDWFISQTNYSNKAGEYEGLTNNISYVDSTVFSNYLNQYANDKFGTNFAIPYKGEEGGYEPTDATRTKRCIRMAKAPEWEYAAKGGPDTHYYRFAGGNNFDELTPETENELKFKGMSKVLWCITETPFSSDLESNEIVEFIMSYDYANNPWREEMISHINKAFEQPAFNYNIDGVAVSKELFLRVVKTRIRNIGDVENGIRNMSLNLPLHFGWAIADKWSDIQKLSFEDIMNDDVTGGNEETRRVVFGSIDFAELKDKLGEPIATYTHIGSSNVVIDDNGLTEVGYDYENRYDMYKVPISMFNIEPGEYRMLDGKMLPESKNKWVYLLRFRCTSTGREYVKPVRPDFGIKKDIKGAVASMVPVRIKNVEGIIRQGDVALFKIPDGQEPEYCDEYYFTGEEYFAKLILES